MPPQLLRSWGHNDGYIAPGQGQNTPGVNVFFLQKCNSSVNFVAANFSHLITL